MDKVRKRCPNGTRMNKKTKKCEAIIKGNAERPVVLPKKTKKTMEKNCPPNKPLYNPNTNRCVLDNALNRKKLSLIKTQKPVDVPIYNILKCDKKLYENIDLNKIVYETTSSGINLSYKVNRKTLPLKFQKLLGEGSYGRVDQYTDASGKYNVALKTLYKKDDKEIKILDKLEKKNIDCNILSSKLLKGVKYSYVISELYSSSLNDIDLLKSLSFEIKIAIIVQLAGDLLCLYNNGFPYTDIKAENTLYKCLSNGKFKITLGDIGSICLDKFDGISTFPPWEYKNGNNVKCEQKQIVWGLGILLLFLLYNNLNLYPFYWEDITNITESTMKQYIKMYLSDSSIMNYILPGKIDDRGNAVTLNRVISGMLRLNPDDIIKLKTVIYYLKQ